LLTFQKQDDSAPEPELLNYLYQAELKKLYSVSIYVWEHLETTEAWKQLNSRYMSAQNYCNLLGIERPAGVQDELRPKKKKYGHNKIRKHSMLS